MKIYRPMIADNEKPRLGENARTLGVRVPKDITPDGDGDVHPNTGGMSVRPNPKDIPLEFVPKRLRTTFLGAVGPDSNVIFSFGDGPFVAGPLAPHLVLRPDKPRHGNVEPAVLTSLGAFRAAIAATREDWSRDEP